MNIYEAREQRFSWKINDSNRGGVQVFGSFQKLAVFAYQNLAIGDKSAIRVEQLRTVECIHRSTLFPPIQTSLTGFVPKRVDKVAPVAALQYEEIRGTSCLRAGLHR